jgi:hypothetical protein
MAYNLVLGAIQFLHFLIDAFVMSYVFIFNPMYDIYFVTFVLLQTMHWGALKNECFISYIEKKMISPNYELGSKPNWIPHYRHYYNKVGLTLKSIFTVGGLLFIIYRAKKNHIRFLCALAILLWLFFVYFYKKSQQ